MFGLIPIRAWKILLYRYNPWTTVVFIAMLAFSRRSKYKITMLYTRGIVTSFVCKFDLLNENGNQHIFVRYRADDIWQYADPINRGFSNSWNQIAYTCILLSFNRLQFVQVLEGREFDECLEKDSRYTISPGNNITQGKNNFIYLIERLSNASPMCSYRYPMRWSMLQIWCDLRLCH